MVSTLENIQNKESFKILYEIINSKELIEKEKIKKINTELKTLISSNYNWDDFKIQFEKVHPKFFDYLHQQFPNLTTTAHRHIAYIKIGMTTKEIAKLLNITPASVQKSRVRLKKKLNLTKDDDLFDFIKNKIIS